MPPKKSKELPENPPSEAFVNAVVRKYKTKTIMNEAVWGKIIKDSQAEVTAKYGVAIKKEFLFDNVSKLLKSTGIDLQSVPADMENLTERLQKLRDAFAKAGTVANYEHRYDELAEAYNAKYAAVPAAAEKSVEPALEVKEGEPALSKSSVLGAKFKKYAGSLKGKREAYINERDRFQQSIVQNLAGQSAGIAERLMRSGIHTSAPVLKDLLAVRTGLDFSGVDMSKSTLGTFAEQLGLMLQDLPLSSKFKGKYKYLGAYRGSLEALLKGEKPINQLDALAAIHDLAYLEASVLPTKHDRDTAVRYADQDFVAAASSLQYTEQDEEVKADAAIAHKAMSAKSSVEGYTGKFSLTTAGVKRLSRQELVEKTKRVTGEIKRIAEDVTDEGVRADLRSYLDEIANIEARQFIIDPELEPIAKLIDAAEARKLERAAKKAASSAATLGGMSQSMFPPQAPAPLDPGEAAEQSEVETTGAPGGIEKKSMGLEDVLKNLAKMNSSTNPLSITPVTGERNLRPLLVRGDVENIVKRTPKEIADNRNYYAAWKWVQEGAGNGNQQPLPDQVGMPANNRIWDMQKRNEQLKYCYNFDGGAADWYAHKKATLGKYVRTVPIVKKKYVIPMYSDNQRHQWPTRNGGLPAGVGRVIKMARDKADGFEIFSPIQVLMSKQTRLFHGDVVESEGRLTRV